MAGKADAARRALRNVEHLHPVHVESIMNALDGAGLLDNPRNSGGDFGEVRAQRTAPRTVLTALEAKADPRNHVLLRTAKAEAERLGFTWDESKQISMHALNSALRGQQDTDRKMRLKEALYTLRLTPA